MPYAHSDQANAEMGAISGDVRNRLKLEGGRPFVLKLNLHLLAISPLQSKNLSQG